jgi:hypothetical protein
MEAEENVQRPTSNVQCRTGEEDKVPPRDLSFTDEEKVLIFEARRQSDAQAIAQKLLGRRVRPKQIRGRCCLFVGMAQSTSYTGYTWAGAIARLIYLRKVEAPEAGTLIPEAAKAAPLLVSELAPRIPEPTL